MELRRHIGGDFHPSGALSISTVPRAETALVVVFDPRGPRRAYIDYFRLNPKLSAANIRHLLASTLRRRPKFFQCFEPNFF